MGLKELLLNKGWAGTTMSRAETIERLNPLIRKHYELNHSYEFAINNVSSPEVSRNLTMVQKTARVDVGKLSETILSAGGVPYNGIDLEPEAFHLGSTDSELYRKLKDVESDFEQLIAAELEENHQIRTKAVLSVVLANSRARLEFLRGATRDQRRTYTGRQAGDPTSKPHTAETK